jgi:hypothetical protein
LRRFEEQRHPCTVLASFLWPSKSWTARSFPVLLFDIDASCADTPLKIAEIEAR